MDESTPRARAELELDQKPGAPEGVLTAGDGRRFPFSGWTELAAVIEEWRSGAHGTRPGRDGEGQEGP